MIILYGLGAWLVVALLLAWPVGMLCKTRLTPRRRPDVALAADSDRWDDVKVPAS